MCTTDIWVLYYWPQIIHFIIYFWKVYILFLNSFLCYTFVHNLLYFYILFNVMYYILRITYDFCHI